MRRSGGTPRIALDQAVLHLDRAAHRVSHAAELDDCAVAGSLDDAAVMGADGGVDKIAAQPPDARQRALLVNAGEPAVADNIRDQDGRELAGIPGKGRPKFWSAPPRKHGGASVVISAAREGLIS
jgi:hypothetical protein